VGSLPRARLKPQRLYVVEPLLLYERSTGRLAKEFENEFKVKLNKIIHTQVTCATAYA
jgi:hypothetical protein